MSHAKSNGVSVRDAMDDLTENSQYFRLLLRAAGENIDKATGSAEISRPPRRAPSRTVMMRRARRVRESQSIAKARTSTIKATTTARTPTSPTPATPAITPTRWHWNMPPVTAARWTNLTAICFRVTDSFRHLETRQQAIERVNVGFGYHNTYSAEDEALLCQLYDEGHGSKLIAAILGRSQGSVVSKANRLGRKFKRF